MAQVSLKIGIIGAGIAGQRHAEAFARHPRGPCLTFASCKGVRVNRREGVSDTPWNTVGTGDSR